MALLDSLIAFALTLAALATVVTILLEIFVRWLGMKRRGQVRLIGRVLDHSLAAHLPGQEQRWNAIKDVLQNPFSGVSMAARQDAQKYWGTHAGGVYTDVSLEHVLRRLLESDATASLLKETDEALRTRLHALANKYEEYCSALAADFKRNAQMWSIFVGIALALAMNIEGVRLLQTYLQDSDLRQSVVENLSAPQGAQPPALAGADDVEVYVTELKSALSGIGDLALPLGMSYFPHCYLPALLAAEADGSADPLCTAEVVRAGWLAAVTTWLLKTLVTGVLIGLGAPFWHDVARRLAAVRTAFGGTAAGEERYRGSYARQPEDREALIRRAIQDAREARSQPAASAAGAGSVDRDAGPARRRPRVSAPQ